MSAGRGACVGGMLSGRGRSPKSRNPGVIAGWQREPRLIEKEVECALTSVDRLRTKSQGELGQGHSRCVLGVSILGGRGCAKGWKERDLCSHDELPMLSVLAHALFVRQLDERPLIDDTLQERKPLARERQMRQAVLISV